MKKNKTLLVITIVLALVLVGVIGYTTYARYVGNRTGSAVVDVAAWSVKVDGVAIGGSNTPTAFTKDIAWNNNGNVVSGQIAPGMTGTTSFTIDPTGTEVALDYYVKVTPAAGIDNDNISISTVKVGGADLTLVPAGTCSNPDHSTQATCTGEGETWNSNAYAGYYMGTIALPSGAIMTNSQIVNPSVTVTWNDDNTTEANTADTNTGITNANSTLDFDVVVVQKTA